MPIISLSNNLKLGEVIFKGFILLLSLSLLLILMIMGTKAEEYLGRKQSSDPVRALVSFVYPLRTG